MKTPPTRILAMLALLIGASISRSATVIVPHSVELAEGNISQDFPFTPKDGVPTHYQQVFSSTEFSSLSGPVFITAISLRPDATQGPFSTTVGNIQINLSTTTRSPGNLSTTFATNVGADNTVVFNGALLLSSASTGPGPGPRDFDVIIPFSNPFLYDPSSGSLLLDVRNISGNASYYQLDANSDETDGVSRVYTQAISPDSPIAEHVDTSGLVVRFTTVDVPEPGCALLLSFGLAFVFTDRRRNP